MKKGIYLTLVTLTLVMQGCIKDYIKDHHDHYTGCGHDQDPSAEQEPTVKISRTQVIVRYDPLLSLPNSEKAVIRAEYGITDFEPCSCGDPNLELWGNETDILDVEGVVRSLRGNSEAEGDFQFSFEVPDVGDFFPLGQEPDSVVLASRTEPFDGNKLSIAVLDTGIDYFRDASADPILYFNEQPAACPFTSGYNFVDPSQDVLDYHGHGTFVTKLITSTLDTKGIGYQILPLKVFDGDGEGTFWNVVCAIGYLKQLEAEGGNIDIVNASFGGTIEESLFDDKGLLHKMINEMQNDMLFVASAGNNSLDTDNGVLKHFPSGYQADNLLAVGGYKDTLGVISIHPESNYGNISIDLAVPFEGWKAEFEDGTSVELRGTSFSTAYVTALVSEFYDNNSRPDPLPLKTNFLGTADVLPSLNDTINGSRAIIR